MVILQFIIGFLLRVEMFKNSLSSSLFTVKRLHKINGNLLALMGKVVASLIVKTNCSEDLFRAWLFCLGGAAILLIVAEVVYRSQSRSIIFSWFFQQRNRQQKYHN